LTATNAARVPAVRSPLTEPRGPSPAPARAFDLQKKFRLTAFVRQVISVFLVLRAPDRAKGQRPLDTNSWKLTQFSFSA
jgi:hypothetical protein